MSLDLFLKGSPWKITFPSRISTDGEFLCDGRVNYDKQLIEIRRSLSKERKGVAIVHEALHVLLEGLNYQEEEEHRIIGHIESAVYELINNFPEKYKIGRK